MKLSTHFFLSEFIISETANKYNIDNTPSEDSIQNLKSLSNNLLENIRLDRANPMKINSGYRSKALNAKVGGCDDSQHCFGKACDIIVYPEEWDDWLNLINNISHMWDFDQMIIYPNRNFIHFSYNGKENRQERLISLEKGHYLPYKCDN